MLVLCIAIKNIKNSELKEFDNYKWNKSSIFMDNWKLYVNDIEKSTGEILTNSSDKKEKFTELKKLGDLAIPLVLEVADDEIISKLLNKICFTPGGYF